jgi:hypothetical protein
MPAALLGAVLLVTAGCRSNPGGGHCMPQAGMSIDQLHDCGCVPMQSGGLDAVAAGAAESGGRVRGVIIVNYLCPLGARGFAYVSVRNGIAEEVFR